MLLLAAVLAFPLIYGKKICPHDKFFTGLIGVPGVEVCDPNFYLGWGPSQAAKGHLLFEDKFNGYDMRDEGRGTRDEGKLKTQNSNTQTLKHSNTQLRRVVFNTWWLVSGSVSGFTGISVLTYNCLQRIICSLLLALVMYCFITLFIEKPVWRMLALIFATFSGYVAAPFPEANIFICMLWEVILPMGHILFFITLYFGYKTLFINSEGQITDKYLPIKTGLLALLLASVYPYAIMSTYFIFGTSGLYLVIKRKNFKNIITSYLTIMFLSLPMVLYDFYLVITDPRLTDGQATFPSMDIFTLLKGFGVLTVLALAGIYFVIKNKDHKYAFIIIWLLTTFVQIYIPISLIPFQMQLIVGIQLPMVILGIYAMFNLFNYLKLHIINNTKSSYITGILLFIIFFGLTSFFNIGIYADIVKNLKTYRLPVYMNIKTKEALDWLSKNTKDDELVISAPIIASYIPVLANNRVYSGDYWANTANFSEKEKNIHWLFAQDIQKTTEDMMTFLKNNGVDYIFYDEHAYLLGGEEMKATFIAIPSLHKAFDNGAVSVFKVDRK